MSQHTDAHKPLLVLAFSAALIALTVSYTVDAGPLSDNAAPAAVAVASYTGTPEAFEMPSLAPSAIVLAGTPTFRAEQGLVKLFFAPSKTNIPLSADSALLEIAAAIQDGKRAQIAGFHDETGNAQQNIELATKRAQVVQKRLIELGAPSQAIELLKPAVGAKDNHSEARRVEVALLR